MATIAEPIANIGNYQGTMTKPVVGMTPAEREAYYAATSLKTKERLFAIGQPLVHEKNGQIIAEYANGSIEIIH